MPTPTEGPSVHRDGRAARHQRLVTVVVGLVVAAVFLGEVGALVYWAGGSVTQRLGFVLAAVGVYSIGIGFLNRTELADESELDERMTSSNVATFIAANFELAGIVFLIFSLAVRGQRSLLGGLVTVALVGPLFAVVAVYLLVVVPFAYVSHLLLSPITTGIIAAPGELSITDVSEQRAIGLKTLIVEHESAFKSFLLGVPAVLFSLVSAGLSLLT